MKQNPLLLFLAGLVMVGIVIAVFIAATSKPQPTTTGGTPITTPPLTSSPNIPTAVPIVPTTIKGTVTQINGTTITVKGDSQTRTFSIQNAGDLQKVVSGSYGNNLKTGQATAADIKVGSELYLVIDKRTDKVVGVLITNP